MYGNGRNNRLQMKQLWHDYMINSKRWQESSSGWVDTMTKSKENKAEYEKYFKLTENPVPYRDWLREKVNGTTTSSTKTSK